MTRVSKLMVGLVSLLAVGCSSSSASDSSNMDASPDAGKTPPASAGAPTATPRAFSPQLSGAKSLGGAPKATPSAGQ